MCKFAHKEVKPLDLSKINIKVPITEKKGMVFYEIFVRSFYDSNGDGIGDLKGIEEKLDYIQNLGVNGIWLSPIFESPSYHGYDVTDYYRIKEELGTFEDFVNLIKEAHRRNIKVIIDFVPNHTSSMHPWFIEARKSKNNKYRDYYVWSDKNTNLTELSDIGQRAWHKSGDSFYYANFWSEMPDLNFDNKRVRKEIKEIAEFWLDKGVDGFRIDAARHIYPQNRIQDTLIWWQEFGDYVRIIKSDTYLVGEIWTSENIIGKYFKVMDSCFNFPLAEEIIKAATSGRTVNLKLIMENTYPKYGNINKNFVDAPFLTNHDMNRVMSRLKSMEKMKTAAAIYLTLPGNPFIYYGEEIGMLGEKPDEKIREPFKWYKNSGKGQTTWERLDYNIGKNSTSVEEMDNKNDSLLNFYRDMIKFRLSNDVLTKGDIKLLNTDDKTLAYLRTYESNSNLIVHNLGDSSVTLTIHLPQDIQLKGEIIKGKGDMNINNGDINLNLNRNSFIIIK
ncbi:alpha-amylase [Fervidicella metallireducens AeB]|uniref:Alpha-amylase n=1 Tax=Fervidicella metallireducens AeB TaxID=1403537 RepID=A0A017RXS7_9CLOT|nr:alpha-amylase family glycosyl hydrolase [Fervidicella metallireducens]EYE89209.1 alpha-amylase [Fervidicella metallireducens AeB]